MTKGLIVSRNRLQTLNGLKRSTKISEELLFYINKYQLTYKNLITEAKKEKMIDLFSHQKIKLREYGR